MASNSDQHRPSKTVIAGAAIGSAAIAAALLFVSRRKGRQAKSETVYLPPRPQDAPETD